MKSQEILDKQKQILWTNHILYYTEPLPLDHGEGLYVWDVEGRRYLDFFGGILTTSVGHNHPQVVEAVRDWRMAAADLEYFLGGPWPESEKPAEIPPHTPEEIIEAPDAP